MSSMGSSVSGRSQEWRPGRIRSKARRRHALLVPAGDVDRVERRPAATARIAEEHDDPAVGRKGRAFVVVALGEDALALAVRPHGADGEAALAELGESDQIAARRPDRCRIGAVAEADALGALPVRTHHINLLRAAAVAFEANARAVRRVGRRGVDRWTGGELNPLLG